MVSGILHWPELQGYVPDGLLAVDGEVGSLRCWTTHPGVLEAAWANAPVGVARFALTPALPEGFFAAGEQSAEYQSGFVMWARGGRRFHFRDYYAGGGWEAVEGADLAGRARGNLRRALGEWEKSGDRLVTNMPFGLAGMTSRAPRALDVAIAHLVAQELGITLPETTNQGGSMSETNGTPMSVSAMRSMVMALMGAMPEGPCDMRMIVQVLAKGSPANFGNVVPMTPEHVAKLEGDKAAALQKLAEVRRLHERANDGSCAACRGTAWPCPTWQAITSSAQGRVGAAC